MGLGRVSGAEDSAGWLLPDAAQGRPGEAVDVAAGEAHIAATSLTGDTYVWGQNHHGQCACNPGEDSDNSFLPVPARAGGALTDAVARRAACGRYHTAVLSAEGVVYTFGAGLSGQLGRHANSSAGLSWQPTRVPFTGDDIAGGAILIVQLACGDEHTLCLTDMGRVFAFGGSDHGQLGMGGCRSHRTPLLIRTLNRISEVSAGANWSLLRGHNGKVHLAGKSGQEDAEDCRLLRQIVAPR